ncbi:MAG: hypothetical protein IJ572_03385 [Bacilli bacterium]|nr:hypothetical protein [Bacilli bacterium]
MDKDELEKTRALNELAQLIKESEEKEINIPDDINDIDGRETKDNKEELYNDLTTDEEVKEKSSKDKNNKKQDKKSIKERWNNLSKNKKIMVIVLSILIVVLLIVLLVVLLSPKKGEDKKTVIKEDIILVKDNYEYKNGFLTIFDSKENSLGTYECKNKDENLCYVAYLDNNEDPFAVAINKYSDEEIIKSRSSVYQDRFVFIYDNENASSKTIKLYDMLNNKVLGEYSGIKAYSVENKNAVVLKDSSNKYGLFEFNDTKLQLLIDFKYDFMGLIDKDKDDLVIVKDSKGSYLVDYSDTIKTKVYTSDIMDYNDQYVVVKNSSNKYTVYDYSGEEYNKNYDYIRLINKDYVAVVDKNNLFIRGYSDNKYNEEGYELTNNNWGKVNTFDKDNRLISTVYAFETELDDKKLTIKLANSDNTARVEELNLREGDASSKYNYYSYFNGKLYFYGDEAKKELLGTYECRNSNNISGDTFDNCYVAKNSVFSDSYITPYKENNSTLALYNKKYVFIMDSSNPASEENIDIKFYDLNQAKVLGTYSAIDSDIRSNVTELTLIDTNDTKIIAKLKNSDKYGVIQITNKDANVLFTENGSKNGFRFNKVERANTDFIVQLENNNWQILYGNSNYTSSEFPGKILNYANKHLIVKDNTNKAYIYKSNGDELLSTGYDYIDISKGTCFATVLNNRLDLYNYDGEKLNNETINLNFNNYYNNDKVAFKLSTNGNLVTINVYKSDGTLDYAKTFKTIIQKEEETDNSSEEKEEEGETVNEQ